MSIKPDRVEQELEEQLNVGVNTDPPNVPQFFTNNIVGRMLGYLMGWHYTTGEPIKIACQSDGSVRVAMTSSTVEYNDVKDGTATDAYSAALTFDDTTVALDVWAWDHPLVFQRSIDGGTTWQDEIEISAGVSASFDCQTTDVRVKNKTAGSNARYQFTGWY